ncbi:MAG: hypothetical protein HY814_05805 [Candidatus Riflebacteria bacterium]|nr:hypothetical protein [Candidatus Riflebacteria bacterium]
MSFEISWCRPTLHAIGHGEVITLANAVVRGFDERRVSEHAAVVVGVLALPYFSPGNVVTKVAAIGARADYYVNGSHTCMLECSGSNDPGNRVESMLKRKQRQVLKGKARTVWVSVSNFASRQTALKRVR